VPELPEVETARRGIEPHLLRQTVARVVVREPRLRWRVPPALLRELPHQIIRSVSRRAKYLLLGTDQGTAILHLGMSGSLRIVPAGLPPAPHDHVDIVLTNGQCLRLRDPRRFGALLWTRDDPTKHKLLRDLGPEPLGRDCTGDYLYRASRHRRLALRDFLMNTRVVAGIGNIYANEVAFRAGLRPRRRAGRLTRRDCDRLVIALRKTLEQAIAAGGTTLRDFQNAEGLPGYFQLKLYVYGRAGQPCRRCHTAIRALRMGQRSAFFCPKCQL
jgi:formamidopyrimidine-DNA glycosylase